MQEMCYVKIIEGEREDRFPFSGVFAIKLNSCPSARLFFDYYRQMRISINNRFATFIACLHQLHPPIAYGLRMIVRPDNQTFSSVEVDVCLLVRVGGDHREEVLKASRKAEHEILALLGGYFIDHEWEPVTQAEDFMMLWQPIAWESAHFASINRREEHIRLDQFLQKPHLGFAASAEEPCGQSARSETIYRIKPFQSTDEDVEKVIQTLMMHDEPIVYTVSLTPTRLTKAESKGLLDLIALCEMPDPSQDTSTQMRIFENRARILVESFMVQYDQLSSNPFEMQVMVASTEELPAMFLNMLGGYISPFPKGHQEFSGAELLALQEGGYAVRDAFNAGERSQIIRFHECFGEFPHISNRAPQGLERVKDLFSSDEAAAAFRFPIATDQNIAGFSVHDFRHQPPPREIVENTKTLGDHCCLIGRNTFLGQSLPIAISDQDRHRHMYVVGQTGTGKTTLLKNMILSDMRNGKGLAVIDPHGDLYNDLLRMVPQHRMDDVVLFDATDMDHPAGFNMLECKTPQERHFVMREMRAIMEKFLHDKYGSSKNVITGPIFYKHLQMNTLLVMSDPERPGTLLEFYEIFNHQSFWKKWLPLKWADELLKIWVENVLPQTNYPYQRNPQEASFGEYVNSKFDDFVLDPRMRLIFGQRHSTIQIGEVMNQSKILLINLSKGALGEANASFLGMMLMAIFQKEVMRRGTMPESDRVPFYLYVDEFQSIATETFAGLLSEARKFRMGLILANQFLTQIENKKITDAIFGNVGTIASFRVSQEDAHKLEPLYKPSFYAEDLCDLPNFISSIRTYAAGKTLEPFLMQNIYEEWESDERTAEEVRRRSRMRYGRPRAQVEAEIAESLKLPEQKETPFDVFSD
jgi:hypothetical protein